MAFMFSFFMDEPRVLCMLNEYLSLSLTHSPGTCVISTTANTASYKESLGSELFASCRVHCWSESRRVGILAKCQQGRLAGEPASSTQCVPAARQGEAAQWGKRQLFF